MTKNESNTKLLRALCIVLMALASQYGYSRNDTSFFNVKDYGAKGDNATLNTKSIQATIDQCASKGGGTVLFPSGTYISGTLRLFDNITLHLESGAVLKGSSNLSDYSDMGRTFESAIESPKRPFIYAINASNIAITGKGIIDGNDSVFFDWDKIHPECCFDPAYTRQGGTFENRFPDGPSEFKVSGRPDILITMIECHNILMSGITVRNAPNWSVHLACCDEANVIGVNFLNSLLVPNADALDISNSKNVNISDCTIVAGDDGIAISPCADGFCLQQAENINVSNCTIISRSSGIRIGWAQKGIRNCTFQNLVIYSNRGIGIFSKQNEVVENLLFNNIIIHTRLHSGWWGIGEPIHISQIPLGEWYDTNLDYAGNGKIRNIRFSNIEITSENSIVLYGYNKHSIENIDFQNVRHYFKNSPLNDERGGNFELRPAFDNQYSVFKHNIPAIFAKNVKRLTISDYTLDRDEGLPEYCTNAIYCEDFSDVKISGFKGRPLSQNPECPVIQLENGENATIAGCTVTNPGKTFLFQKNVKNSGFFMNNDLRKVETMLAPSNGDFTIINNLK